MKPVAAALLCMCCGLAGCGYTTRSMIAQEFRTIHVVPFVNKIDITLENNAASKYKIYKPGLETDITRAVADKYLFDGNLKPSEQAVADLTLKGELVEFRRDPLRYTDNDEIEEYRINIVVNLSLFDNRKQQVVWEEKNFTGDTTYFTRGAAVKSDDVAVSDAVKDIARRIVERTVEQW
ncbi:MAG TPA: LPS assembly lipoprotein LptE [Patescibacteria group bacterium]|nr:LPS assembly lipoprotein LptE [Patescibacteria group bacterium]